MLDMQTVVIIVTQLVVGVAVVATMKNDIHHIKQGDEKQNKQLEHLQKIQANHDTRLTLVEEKLR